MHQHAPNKFIWIQCWCTRTSSKQMCNVRSYIFTFCFFIFLCFFQFFCSVSFYFCFLLSAGHRLFFDGVVYLCIDSWFFFCFYVFDCHYIWNLNLDLILLAIFFHFNWTVVNSKCVCLFLLCSDWCWSFTFFLKWFSVFMDLKDFSLYQFFSPL